MLFHPMDFLIFIAFGLSLWAQFRVKGTFARFADTAASSGMTGAEAARRMLDANGLSHIPVEHVPGMLTDHYDPLSKVVRLSDRVYFENSISAISVACHEVGHAIQHKAAYPMLVARHYIFPVVNLTSGVAPLLLLAGIFMGLSGLTLLGIIFFSVAVTFQLITLPVEFNASSRAKRLMTEMGFINGAAEQAGVSKVLNAAALTYVAAALVSLLELLKFIMIFRSEE
ncbi:zinc metallopeptidase [Brevibacillus humidisoli]|uniref:zinc metallopeptidase n=1 Tax=Brevibacillus humidisoli TaxID=2895522 RepID=UPI001E5521C0|nr:zinc metallopeptidase [Brevibacillus humidisoli]UFJ39538.1 zinc metallopeptidase [Brevibacillus humidisoli]